MAMGRLLASCATVGVVRIRRCSSAKDEEINFNGGNPFYLCLYWRSSAECAIRTFLIDVNTWNAVCPFNPLQWKWIRRQRRTECLLYALPALPSNPSSWQTQLRTRSEAVPFMPRKCDHKMECRRFPVVISTAMRIELLNFATEPGSEKKKTCSELIIQLINTLCVFVVVLVAVKPTLHTNTHTDEGRSSQNNLPAHQLPQPAAVWIRRERFWFKAFRIHKFRAWKTDILIECLEFDGITSSSLVLLPTDASRFRMSAIKFCFHVVAHCA